MKFSINKYIKINISAVMVTLLLTAGIMSANAEPRTNKNNAKNQAEFTVVIDAGHGGHDYGAVDNSVNEKDINLNVANKLASLIKKRMKNVKVVMTRDDDTFISLQERANIANRNKGNLFISIHTNSVDKSNPNRKSVAGTSVYALGPQKDANNLKVAQRENSVIELEDNYHQKYSGFDPSKDESYIIFEMAQKKNLGQSLKFADKAQKELVATAGRKDRGVKQAGFWVLWATSMPSVLVELDFICNPEEAKYLDSKEGQDQLAEALCNALESYIASYKKPQADNAKHTGTESKTENGTASKAENADVGDSENSAQEDVKTLVASTPKAEKNRGPQATESATNRTYGKQPRRRRSNSSKTISDNKSFETEEIHLKDETRFLAVREETVKETEPTAESKVADKSRNKKKQKKTKEKKPSTAKETRLANNKAESKHGTSNPNRKTFTVKSGNVTTSQASPAGKPANTSVTAQRLNDLQNKNDVKMVYKIQLLASETEKKNDDPAFCGLTPSGMFRENGKFKYTYGSSSNRHEIEEKLLEIKPLLPEATIIVCME